MYECTHRFEEAEDYYISLHAPAKIKWQTLFKSDEEVICAEFVAKPPQHPAPDLYLVETSSYFFITVQKNRFRCLNIHLIHSTTSCDAGPEVPLLPLGNTDLGWGVGPGGGM
jgi:hypothetical protein